VPRLDAFFEAAGDGREGLRLYLHHRPDGAAPRGAVLYLHPFAEEMNKSRRMAALQVRRLAEAGYAVLQVDLEGCGDNPGDFGDATWDGWVADAVQAARWLATRHDAPLWLWGVRAGALLASAAAPQLDAPCHFLFWQPATHGKTVLQQFLRLKVAADMLDGSAKGVMDSLRAQLRAGQTVEIAGYPLHPSLAAGLEKASLDPPPRAGRVEWFEVQAQPGDEPSPAAARVAGIWQSAGFEVRTQVVAGPPFWQTADIEEAPALLDATLRALGSLPAGAARNPQTDRAQRSAAPALGS
jgi:exosortase A-associated hydrolase 2